MKVWSTGEEERVPGGRPPKGPKLVEGLSGSPEAKRKLKVILETVSGTMTILEACAKLGVGEAMFHALRERTLTEAIEGLEPRPMGRPSKEQSAERSRVVKLEEENERLKRQLQAAWVREEIAVSMPGLLGRGKSPLKKTRR